MKRTLLACPVATLLLLGTFSTVARALEPESADSATANRGRPLLLVDLEDQLPGRPSFTGRAWQLDHGVVALAGDTLWRLEQPGTPPTPLLRGASWPATHDLGDGALVLRAHSLDGQEAYWITDGGPARLLAPPEWQPFAMSADTALARRGDVILAKSARLGDDGSWLWRVEEQLRPHRIEPSGIFGSDDPTAQSCTGVVAAPNGFVTCGLDAPPDRAVLRFGTGGPTQPAPEWPYELVERGPEYGGYRYFTAFQRGEWRYDLLRSDGTAAGTSLVAQDVARPPVVAWGKLAFLRRPTPSSWEVLLTDGSAAPQTIATISTQGYSNTFVATGDWFYTLHQESSGLTVHAVSESGAVQTLGPIPAALRSAAAGDDNGTLLLQVRTAGDFETWRANATLGVLEPLPQAGGGLDDFVLKGLPGGALIPWLDQDGYPRAASLGAGGKLEPREELTLPGTAGSAFAYLGELDGKALFYASTAAHGRAVWISDAMPAGTRPLFHSRCHRLAGTRPRLDGPDLVVDCLSPGKVATVWRLRAVGAPVPTEITFPEVHLTSLPPRIVRLGSRLVYLDAIRGIVAREIGSATSTDLIPGCSGRPAATATRAVVRCEDEVWTTDGTPAGTTILRESTHNFWPLIEAGGRIVGTGPDAFLTDGTSAGTISISSNRGAAQAPAAAKSICVWDDAGLSALDLNSGQTFRIRDMPLSQVLEIAKSSQATRHLLKIRTTPPDGLSLWVCDPEQATVHRIDRYEGDPWLTSGWPGGIHDGQALWRHVVDPTEERLERLTFSTGRWNTIHRQRRVLNDESGGFDSVPTSPLGVVDGKLWIGLADEQHGREPWLLPVPTR